MRPYKDWPAVRWARKHRFTVDATIAVVLVAISIVVHVVQREVDDRSYVDPSPWTVALVILACAPLAWRRKRPIPSALAIVGLQIVLEFAEINGPAWVPTFFAFYSLGACSAGRPRMRALAALMVGVAVLLIAGLIDRVPGLDVLSAVALLTMLAVCFFVGDNMRRRRNEIADLGARADTAERERELLANRRVTEERTRIARELHDVVAHSVSVMVIQASAAHRNLRRDTDSAAALLVNIEETGRQTMRELRSLLGVLRDTGDGIEGAPPMVPMLCDLDALVASIPELEVRLFRSGSLDEVPIGIALAAYRVVQEALTNAQRHAGPNVIVDVEVACSAERVDVSVSDNGRGASTRAASTQPDESAGYGLIGMSERVAAFAGALTAGPRSSGGWQVRASFPLESATVVNLAS